ncbi:MULTISPECIES: sigma-70 family RNA polymerase sigma factor [Acidocella]|uniref:sigma-70 family RNA polymerase sigma factor n=1 Tax=Acidocella TaxID=50709 RepID=UPI00028CD7A0|nr:MULTISPECIES: sigma-70 family RNA polymerase sigma factor [Acidocella]EKM98316.1 RNA polymerase sigma factor for flagellar operon [Acidocella sp. MX-AZ02]WBO59324.1 sigma-70 family RNA polymerase sigma factor [Acidocella sp. MX-AZ03]
MAEICAADMPTYGNWIKRTALLLKSRMPWAELDDLLQWGAVGLLEAHGRFEDAYGVTFQTYAMRRIKGAMLDGLRRSKSFRFTQGTDETMIDLHAEENGMLPEDPLSLMLQSERQGVLVEALRELEPEEYQMLALHFFEELNNREIALVLDVSDSYASKLRARALARLSTLVRAKLEGVPAT